MTVATFILVFVILFCVVPEFRSSNFPLDNCSTIEMDILGLYFDTDAKRENILYDQKGAFSGLVNHLLNLNYANTTPQVQFAHVHDSVSSNLPNFNFSSWQFETSYNLESYGVYSQQYISQTYSSVVEAITLKIQFVERLFSEMGGVRDNVSHIAVIFLNGDYLSYDEKRDVPHIVGQHKTEIKIFVLVVSVSNDNEMVHLTDTLLVRSSVMSEHLLIMAMCNQCMVGWFMYEHQDDVQFLSCYKHNDYGINIEAVSLWQYVFSECQLTSFETNDELVFVRNKLYTYFKENGQQQDNITTTSNVITKMYIGLTRNSTSNTRRYSWITQKPLRKRPNVVDNWFPGKPSLGKAIGCTVWQFDWKDNVSGSDAISSSDEIFLDGWTDVDCDSPAAPIRFCEFELPRRIDNRNIRQIKPATKQIFNETFTKGDFVIFQSNIVSVSANIADNTFLLFIKNTYKEQMFPIFDCGVDAASFRYISYLFVCDSINHCSNNRDETSCFTCPFDCEERAKICSGVYCCDWSCLPLQWVNDGEVDCTICDYSTDKTFTDESLVLHKYLKQNLTCALICNDDQCVELSQLGDGRVDCTGIEGPLDETIGRLEAANTCRNILGHWIWAPRCVFVRDMYGGVMGCRDMSHLSNCSNFDCPDGYFKCTYSYCIPQHYVMDEKVDCPTGEDEQRDIIGPCSGNFACWNSKVCLHPSLVCNGNPDCPRGDDELDCRDKCTDGFHCVAGTMTVAGYNMHTPLTHLNIYSGRTIYIDWHGVNLSNATFFEIFYATSAVVIIWSNCQIRSSDYLLCFCLIKVQDLDMSFNRLQALDGRDNYHDFLTNIRRLNFSNNRELASVKYLKFELLETLDLSHTAVADIGTSLFSGLPKLKHLDLSFTFIINLNRNAFPSNLVLQFLDITGLVVSTFTEDFFNSLTIDLHLYTDRFELCCPQIRGPNILSHKCHGPSDAISSCFDLIRDGTQRVLIWVVAGLAVLGNMTVIVYRVIWDRSALRSGYGLFVINLGISDFIMGVYLFIIAGADYYFRDNYVLHDPFWRKSVGCKVAGFLVTLSSETSIFFVLLITLDRFLVMKFPFGQIYFSKLTKVLSTLLSWTVGFLIAVVPIVLNCEIYSFNGVCLGLPFTTQRILGWEFSFSVFIALNFVLCLVIAYSQRAIFRAMSENRINATASNTPSRRPEDLVVAKQLSLVAIANFLCWFPIIIMGLLSLGKYEISNNIYAWTMIVVLPLNSAANPILYTIPALMDKWDKLKNGKKRTVKP